MAVLLLESETSVFAGAGAFKVIVPVVGLPPMTVAGLRETEPSKGIMVMESVLVTPAKLAEIVTFLLAVTMLVVTVKGALVLPAGTVTEAGTWAAAVLLLDNDTTVS